MKLVTPIRRNGFWVLRRRVPKRFAGFDTRRIVRISTRIRVADDPKAITATPIAQQLHRTLEAEWLALANGEKPGARRRYDDAVLDAKGLGFTYLTTPELALRPLEEILRRIERLMARRTGDVPEEVTALLGGEDRPVVRVSELKTEYEALQQAALAQMSPDQRRKWHNQRKRAVANFREAICDDKRLSDLTKADGLKFRKWWQDRVVNDGVQIRTANKSIGTVSRMLKRVSDAKELGVSAILAGLRIEGGVARQRPPFEISFIKARILAPDVFDDLNEEARRVVYLMVETGLRPSEIVNLTAKRIVLDHRVPHVVIEAEGRVLKSETSERKIPLVGVSLAAMRLQPQGFPRYYDKGSTLSANVNKFMESHRLRPTERHTLYSLRHSFEDRLTALKVMDKVVAYLMGHEYDRPKYGSPPTLEHLRSVLQRMAFKRFPEVL